MINLFFGSGVSGYASDHRMPHTESDDPVHIRWRNIKIIFSISRAGFTRRSFVARRLIAARWLVNWQRVL